MRLWIVAIIAVIVFLILCILIAAVVAGECLVKTRRKKLKRLYGDNKPNDIEIISKEGNIRLKGWHFIPKNNDNKFVIFCVGYGCTREVSPFPLVLQPLLDNGYNVVTFDFRRCGESEGSIVTAGAKEIFDLESVIEYVKNELHAKRIALLGFSQGANVAVRTLQNGNICACVADSPFINLDGYLRANLHRWSRLPKCFNPLIMAYFKLRSGIDAKSVDALESLKNAQTKPLFLIHATDDDSISYTESEGIYASRENKYITQFWNPKTGGHCDACVLNTNEYIYKLMEFLNKYCQ